MIMMNAVIARPIWSVQSPVMEWQRAKDEMTVFSRFEVVGDCSFHRFHRLTMSFPGGTGTNQSWNRKSTRTKQTRKIKKKKN